MKCSNIYEKQRDCLKYAKVQKGQKGPKRSKKVKKVQIGQKGPKRSKKVQKGPEIFFFQKPN